MNRWQLGLLSRAMAFLVLGFSLILSGCGGGGEKRPETAPAKEALAAQETEVAPATDPESAYVPRTKEAVLPWSYSGATGPNHWAELDPLYSRCKTGKRQSPIDLRWRRPKKGNNLDLAYKETTLRVIDNGYTVQVNVDPGSFLKIGDEKFELTNLQFHSPSEHSLSGNSLAMEMQLYHKDDKGVLAVLSVMMIEGAHNDLIDKIWAAIPGKKFSEASDPRFVYNPQELIPKRLTHYAYLGSLTTPPCTEGVRWHVFNTPITLSREQIVTFRKFYSVNNRPLQPLNGRTVTNY